MGTATKGSSKMAYFSHPRPISWIVVSVGGLAVFLIYASLVLVSSTIGATFHDFLYGVGSSGKLDGSVVSSINKDTIDAILNKSLGLVDDKPSSDPQSSAVSAGVSSDSKVEPTDAKSSSQVELSGSSLVNSLITKEGSGIETSDAGASNSQESVTSFGNGTDTANSSLPAKSDPQIDLSLAGTNSSSAETTTSNEATPTAVPESREKPNNISSADAVNSDCDLYHGNWIYDPLGPLYTNNSCPIITQMQNCQGNGRPDKDYEDFRWKPSQCDIPRFDPKIFLERMRGKTLAFIGDSVARNQMESMLCILWQVEEPKNQGNRNMQRYYFSSTSVMIIRIWSSWLVKLTSEPFDFAPAGVDKLFLDVPEEKLMEHIPKFDVVVLSSGHWFVKQSVYILNNEIVGGQLWWPDKSKPMKINSVEAYRISVETILTALVTHPNYTGITIVRSYSPDHYEGGAWNTGGSCTGKVKPLAPGELVENVYTNDMHKQQVTGFNSAIKKATNRSKLKLMDITEVFQYRHDGHPGPYRSLDPNKITKRGRDGRPPPQDCLHWCMPGPVDTWNELVFEIIKRELD
ncbi:PREDICTED: protein YLS7-like [Lupinus angustifolius]|uniref:protein YLS7-like n=1 Tax=Lupinus angustifolius TaxID=3871 RepID=UPI00092EBFA3|nr:PREDICTED: protein YLS7-like [Lupinus angustifolius]